MYKLIHRRFRSICTMHVDNSKDSWRYKVTDAMGQDQSESLCKPVTDRDLYPANVRTKIQCCHLSLKNKQSRAASEQKKKKEKKFDLPLVVIRVPIQFSNNFTNDTILKIAFWLCWNVDFVYFKHLNQSKESLKVYIQEFL